MHPGGCWWSRAADGDVTRQIDQAKCNLLDALAEVRTRDLRCGNQTVVVARGSDYLSTICNRKRATNFSCLIEITLEIPSYYFYRK